MNTLWPQKSLNNSVLVFHGNQILIEMKISLVLWFVIIEQQTQVVERCEWDSSMFNVYVIRAGVPVHQPIVNQCTSECSQVGIV